MAGGVMDWWELDADISLKKEFRTKSIVAGYQLDPSWTSVEDLPEPARSVLSLCAPPGDWLIVRAVPADLPVLLPPQASMRARHAPGP